ncbi:protein FAR1-RELATED SEQUENCE 6-like [Juglans microcarpa x Juglans regia]|uniref:protein FAR1-RELATED SEQUENCE 6-like n=1 Tax=Juglans microcarpa x Juglans regia TaxID=2249226 RepID=UPI001B7E4057|nr:protein FAR1-RELATED SEQUENCE 6-like [Juglans microcarpa x Juglans regia]
MQLNNVFWADARSRAAYESFGDVIVFDTTYLTNVYKMPFGQFVGVNHHGQSVLLGCGLISNEDANTFEWLFESWLKCINDQPPNASITDQDKTMKITISRVFPMSRHRFCLWHTMKKLLEKFGSHSRYEEIKSTLHRCIYDSFSELEFESQWHDILDTYDLHENAWLYDSTLMRKAENEAIADFNSFNKEIPCITRYPLEKSTFEVADEIRVGDDLLKHATFTVKIDEDPLDVKCSCKLFEFRGILCRHALRILTQLGNHIVLSKYILDRWRNVVKRKYTFVKSSYDTSSIDDARRYDRIQNCFYELCFNASKSESNCVKLINQIEQLKVQYPGIADPATSMGGTTVDPDTSIGGTTVDPAMSMGGTTSRVLSPLYMPHQIYTMDFFGIGQAAPPSQAQWRGLHVSDQDNDARN